MTAQIDEDPAITLAWKSPKPSEVEITLPLKEAEPGPVNLEIDEFGMAKPDRLKMVAYAAAASVYGLTLNSGDKIALMKGTRLDEVAKAEVGGVTFTPSTLDRVENLDQLQMNSVGSTDSLEAGKAVCRPGGIERWPHAESAGDRRSAAPEGDTAQRRNSGGRHRDLTRGDEQPRGPASGRPPGLLHQVRCPA